MRHYDTIIIGGGPAGNAAAYQLSNAGQQVLILEKTAFPRMKACAGMLTMKALHRLPYSIAPIIQYKSSDMTVGYYLKKSHEIKGKNPLVVTTIRSELDEFCLNKAIESGSEFEIISGLKSLSEANELVELETKCGQSFTAKFLIGADGAHSQVRQLSNCFSPAKAGVALEGIVPYEASSAKVRVQFDFGVAKNGYGWLIPKKDHFNVGLYARQPHKKSACKQALRDYAMHHLGTSDVKDIVGHPLATNGDYYQHKMKRIFLVGDAAGYAEPLLGEGIHNAIASGQTAAKAIIENLQTGKDASEIYHKESKELMADLVFCRQASRGFYKILPLSYQLLRRYPVGPVFINGYAGGLNALRSAQLLKKFKTSCDYSQPLSLSDV
ncbi:MAG: geranylgeranyl reductase family protein [Lentisphaeria bacterium]|nr:geranylgeranyl reductase family protein [Lentisphaeria bacterium]NQZ71069.1 geranylgeranyl reductase family protein [Lentisphaeria bacterium]